MPRPVDDTEGFPSLSSDGAAVSFACYKAYSIGGAITDGAVRTYVLVRPDAVTDTSTYSNIASGGSASNAGSGVHTVVYDPGSNRFYYGAAPGYAALGAGGFISMVLGQSGLTLLSPLYVTR